MFSFKTFNCSKNIGSVEQKLFENVLDIINYVKKHNLTKIINQNSIP